MGRTGLVRRLRRAAGMASMIASHLHGAKRSASLPGLLLVEAQRVLEQNDDLVLEAPAIFLRPKDESRMQLQRQPQSYVLDRFFSLGFCHDD